jgi:hybrid polyketide synthase/nonribosomal peptide synthetase ACE1
MTKTTSSPAEPIAIVGSGCRFPGGVNSPSALWKLLESPPDLRQEISPDRFSTTGFYHRDGARHGTTNVRHSYLLDEDVRVFDAPFFNISPNEAEAIDPQQRLLLETVYEAVEAGGYPLEGLRGSDTSVYVGTMSKRMISSFIESLLCSRATHLWCSLNQEAEGGFYHLIETRAQRLHD